MRVLQATYRPGYQYKKAGMLCLDLVLDDEKQASLFVPVDPEREAKERRLMAVVDKLNLWGGRGTVRAGSWIAAVAFVAPGVEIGAGAVVAAGSVVTRDVPPNTLVRGNPAEIVRAVPREAP